MHILALLQETANTAAVGNAGYAGAWGLLGAGIGIGRIGGSAADGIARQPAATNDIRGTAIVLSAFVEGAALFAIVVGLLISLKFAY